MVMFQEVQLVGSDLTSKIRALAHPTCDRHACLEAWLLAHLGCIVACMKFNVFEHSDKQGE